MAITLVVRPMRAVGNLNGGPPLVRHFTLSADACVKGDLMVFDQSLALATVADFDATTFLLSGTASQIDTATITGTWGARAGGADAAVDGDLLLGIAMADGAASATDFPVACFHSQQLFEANWTSQSDGGVAPTALVSLIAHKNAHGYLTASDAALSWVGVDANGDNITNTTPNGIWTLSDTAAAGAPLFSFRVIDIGYGFVGEDALSGHGVIGDSNVRARFVVDPDVTFMGV